MLCTLAYTGVGEHQGQVRISKFEIASVLTGRDRDGEHGGFAGFSPWLTKWQPSARSVRSDLILGGPGIEGLARAYFEGLPNSKKIICLTPSGTKIPFYKIMV